MRIYSLLLASVVSFPAFGDEILATNRITAVTLYPQGALISREVVFEAGVGAHELRLTDLPSETYAERVRLTGEAGLTTGAVWLRSDRLFARDEVLTADQAAAKAVIKAAQAQVDAVADVLAGVQARIEAANAEVTFLAGSRPEGGALTPGALRALSAAVAEGVAAARGRAIAAGAEARPLTEGLSEAVKALGRAQAAYDALPTPDEDYAALSIAVQITVAGTHRLMVNQVVDNAGWAPVYDLTLRRAGAGRLTLARGAMVAQYTGEDWTGVDLTLSTARPSERTEASPLYPDYREIFDPETEGGMLAKSGAEPAMADAMVVAEAAPRTAGLPELQGDVLVYRVPGAVQIASGVENLRLALDEIGFAAKVQALAVPRMDAVAYVTAKFENTSGEVLLPGQVYLYRDANLVGLGHVPLLAAGDEMSVGFGGIDGLMLERKMPQVSEGDRGLLSSETEQVETATLRVKNLTEEVWDVRLLDQVPYSEQEDLEVSFAADPAPDEVDVEGERGILAWEFDLAPGEEQAVEVEHALRWPSGMALR